MARAERVTLFEREIRERLSEAALELLFAHATVISEGECAHAVTPLRPSGSTRGRRAAARRSAFFGSTMLTVDLARVSPSVREPVGPDAAKRVVALMVSDPRVARRARQIAEREASRLAGEPVRPSAADVRMRSRGTEIFIDVDVEGDVLAAPSATSH
jgi:hypothetical protein